MGKNDDFGFSVSNPYSDSKSRRAYDQDKDDGIINSRTSMPKTPKSQNSDLYKEYMRQYEDKREAAGTGKSEPPKSRTDTREEKIELSRYSVKRKKNEKKKRKKKAVIISICAVITILGVLTYLMWPYLNYNRRKITTKPKDLGFEKVIDEKIINIALFGLDTRERGSFEGLSDSIMILSLNTETKKVKVISLMRDTIVNIEHGGESYFSKINSAYQTGGPELAIKTINRTFDLDISNYATINFYGMVDIIDAVGGIDATITEDEIEWQGDDNPNLNNCMDEICEAEGLDAKNYYIHTSGPQQLNGVQAVAYSRVRHCLSAFGTNDDYGRTDRQRHVMQQLFSTAITLSKSKYIKLAKALLPCSETSMGLDDILGLAFNILLKHPSFEQYRVPQMEWIMPFNYVGYGSCVYFDHDYATRAIHSIIYDDLTVEKFVEKNPVEKNDWFAKYGTKTYDDSAEFTESTVTPTDNTDSGGQGEGGTEQGGTEQGGSEQGESGQGEGGTEQGEEGGTEQGEGGSEQSGTEQGEDENT